MKVMSRLVPMIVLNILMCIGFAHAGVFSEIDILVREAAIAEIQSQYTEPQLDRAFYDITYEVAQDSLPGCHFTLLGEMSLETDVYEFTACVMAHGKSDIIVTIINLQQRN